ncbi:hypothetical protein MPS_1179 [Mycobacterium pseudoshottsii JCM 15466]|nr:hypothetical protein MPS_1179 [Mycobacterium pseudoshottsii JCM 15466]
MAPAFCAQYSPYSALASPIAGVLMPKKFVLSNTASRTLLATTTACGIVADNAVL